MSSRVFQSLSATAAFVCTYGAEIFCYTLRLADSCEVAACVHTVAICAQNNRKTIVATVCPSCETEVKNCASRSAAWSRVSMKYTYVNLDVAHVKWIINRCPEYDVGLSGPWMSLNTSANVEYCRTWTWMDTLVLSWL